MLITVLELEREPLEFTETIQSGDIDFGEEIHQIDGLEISGRADLITEHRGPHEDVHDIRVRASFEARFEMLCSRCLEAVLLPVQSQFDLLFRPLGADKGGAERSISTSDTEIGYYQADGLILEDVVREQVLLSLPAKALCRPDCKGLCPGCGRNLNTEACTCDTTRSDPRWTALTDLRSRMKN